MNSQARGPTNWQYTYQPESGILTPRKLRLRLARDVNVALEEQKGNNPFAAISCLKGDFFPAPVTGRVVDGLRRGFQLRRGW
jgi:hypothetical protein